VGEPASAARPAYWRHARRAAALGVTGLSLYLVFPSLLSLFDAWPQLGDVRARWFVVVPALEAASFVALWVLLRIALHGGRWADIASSQLASNAASRIVPGGAATGGAVQASMLIGSGHPAAAVGGALGAVGLLTTGMLLALPVLAVPSLLLGPPVDPTLEYGLLVSVAGAAVLTGAGFAVLRWDRVVRAVARAAGWAVATVGRRASARHVAGRVVAERDRVAAAFRGRWLWALGAAAGNRMLDFAALTASLAAVGAHPRPSLVLIAYVASLALALVPLTPGGLGFVETGLTSLLVLAGTATDQALVGTLMYRLASYWLPIPVGALAWAGWRVTPSARRRRGSATP
jgi:uncharacterized membrane protein YbhN (UPF0104 family)